MLCEDWNFQTLVVVVAAALVSGVFIDPAVIVMFALCLVCVLQWHGIAWQRFGAMMYEVMYCLSWPKTMCHEIRCDALHATLR